MNIRRYIHITFLVLVATIAICACSDELAIEQQGTTAATDSTMAFTVNVLDAPEDAVSRGTSTGNIAVEADNNNSDFKAGDAFGLFVVNADGNTVEEFRNMKLTTPDGKVWNALSSVKTTVHKMGYKYYAYAPYSIDFNNCATVAAIEALFTTPATDQSTDAATDWLYSGLTLPGENGVTLLNFHHRYGVIDIYNSFEGNHQADWLSAHQYTVKTDTNGVKHYRYILNNETPATTSVSGTYNVGNQNTGIRSMKYNVGDITVGNGYHAIVRTSRVSEDYAVDLGLPSGTKWARFNVGAELSSVMTEEQILAAEQQWGTRLAWGELWPKDTYSAATYIDTYDSENKTNALFTTHISGTANDPVKQLWGGHWEMPTQDDFEELKNNVTITRTGPITITATALNGSNPKEYTNVYLYKLTSKVSGYTDKSITMVSCGQVTNGLYNTVYPVDQVYYASGSINTSASYLNNHKNLRINDGKADIIDVRNESGTMIRPVLKETTLWNADNCEALVMKDLVKYSIDFGIRETIDGVEYAVLWAPFNLGAEKTFKSYSTYNGHAPSISNLIDYAKTQLGWYLSWGATEPYADGNYSTTAWSKLPVYSVYHGKTNTTTDWSIELTDEYDAAKVNWGKWDSRWQLPTRADAQKLYAAVNQNTANGGTYGMVTATGKNTGYTSSEAIFPKTGYKKNKNISSTSNAGYLTRTMGIYNAEDKMYMMWGAPMKDNNAGSCYTGVCVRPIIKIPVSELSK